MIKACIFDVGNTLVNGTKMYEDTLQALAHWLRKMKIGAEESSFLKTYKHFNKTLHQPHWSHAFGEIELFKRTLDKLGVVKGNSSEILDKYRELFEANIHPDVDVIETFTHLKGKDMKIALISDERSAFIEMFIKKTKIEMFLDAVIISEAVGVEKPNPIIFMEAKRVLSVDFSEMVIFGDNELTDGGGKLLGMKFVLVKAYRDPSWSWGKGKTVEPDYIIERVTRQEIEKCLKVFSE